MSDIKDETNDKKFKFLINRALDIHSEIVSVCDQAGIGAQVRKENLILEDMNLLMKEFLKMVR